MPLAQSISEQIRTPDRKREYNALLFTRVAREYDLATRAMSLGRDRAWKRRLVRLLPAVAAPRCVDLACGTGDLVMELARRFADAEIIGVDLTPAMIEVARERCPAPRLAFRVADMCRTGLPDGGADFVTGSYALRNAPVLDDALREVNRLLKPGGHAAFLDFAKSPVRWRQALQLPLLKAWGACWGLLIHGRPEHAYIAESLRQFPDRQVLRHRVAAQGFALRASRPCFGGMLEILLLQKAAPAAAGAPQNFRENRIDITGG